MTNYVDTITNSVVTSLDVLKSVNDMYSSEFTRLLTVMGLLVGIVGVAVIVLPLWLQSRETKVRREEMHTMFSGFLEETKKDLDKKLLDSAKQQEKVALKALETFKEEHKKSLAEVAALSAHHEMWLAFQAGQYVPAAKSEALSIMKNLHCDFHGNVLNNLEFLTQHIFPKLKKDDLEVRNLGQDLERLEKELSESNQTGFLNDKLEAFRGAKKEILRR
jgi:hypothetical protein